MARHHGININGIFFLRSDQEAIQARANKTSWNALEKPCAAANTERAKLGLAAFETALDAGTLDPAIQVLSLKYLQRLQHTRAEHEERLRDQQRGDSGSAGGWRRAGQQEPDVAMRGRLANTDEGITGLANTGEGNTASETSMGPLQTGDPWQRYGPLAAANSEMRSAKLHGTEPVQSTAHPRRGQSPMGSDGPPPEGVSASELGTRAPELAGSITAGKGTLDSEASGRVRGSVGQGAAEGSGVGDARGLLQGAGGGTVGVARGQLQGHGGQGEASGRCGDASTGTRSVRSGSTSSDDTFTNDAMSATSLASRNSSRERAAEATMRLCEENDMCAAGNKRGKRRAITLPARHEPPSHVASAPPTPLVQHPSTTFVSSTTFEERLAKMASALRQSQTESLEQLTRQTKKIVGDAQAETLRRVTELVGSERKELDTTLHRIERAQNATAAETDNLRRRLAKAEAAIEQLLAQPLNKAPPGDFWRTLFFHVIQ